MKPRKHAIWLTVNRLGVPPPFMILYLAVYITLTVLGKPVTWERLSFLVPGVVFIWKQGYKEKYTKI